jgi:phospholipase C
LQRFRAGIACYLLAAATLAHAAMPDHKSAARHPGVANPIQHVIIIMQENRSFDSYFGTFPGANGIPLGTCVPLNPAQPTGTCVQPFHDQHDLNAGGPHRSSDAQADLDDGITTSKLDGFIYQQTTGFGQQIKASPPRGVHATKTAFIPGVERHDVMGYHDASELPTYWAYAENFVLQDQMFEGNRGWSLASHLDMASEWTAICTNDGDPSTCVTNPSGIPPKDTKVRYPWANLFQLMDVHNISWKYYLGSGNEPDCSDGEMTCDPEAQQTGVVSIWNPVPGFAWVEAQGSQYLAQHNPQIDQFLVDVNNGTLPQVSWVVPSDTLSEHPPNGVTAGQDYVASLVNAVMQSPYWTNTAIFISWDDWGGFYDHVQPPNVDMNASQAPIQGFGLRVPGLMISAYANAGMIDHNVLAMDSYATFIEDVFMQGARLDPAQLGQPDRRPDIRDSLTSVTFPNGTIAPIGNLMDEFNFSQAPLPPLVLSTYIPINIAIACNSGDPDNPQTCRSSAVRVSWDMVSGQYIPGPFTYQVLRDGTPLPACLTAATQCTDQGAPSGTHYYTVYSVSPANVASPSSAGSEADVP